MRDRRVGALLCVAVLWVACARGDAASRGAGPSRRLISSTTFDRTQSAALFVGVQSFTHDPSLLTVPFAVDDAVDLAWKFSLDRKTNLVLPNRVVLAVSGKPYKKESQQRLEALRTAGAVVVRATYSDILRQLQQQTAKAGADGMFLLGIASHGFNRDGAPHILTATSMQREPQTWLPAARLLDIVSSSHARRSLVFIDACRERVVAGTRGGGDDAPLTTAPLIRGIAKSEGQVVFYAAPAGGVAYDGDGNGVFTEAVIEGLSCDVARNARGIVTVESLAGFIEQRVRTWINKNRDPMVRAATQVTIDGSTAEMPIAICTRPPSPAAVTLAGVMFVAIDENGTQLWNGTAGSPITHSLVVDLEDDGANEVLIAAGSVITAFDADGKLIWSHDARAQVDQMLAAYAYSKKQHRQVITVAGPLLSILDRSGYVLTNYRHDAPVRHVVIDRPTTRHDPRLVVAGGSSVAAIRPRTGRTWWRGVVAPGAIETLEILDRDNDRRRDISLSTPEGRIDITFDGLVLQTTGPRFTLVPQQ